MPHQVVLRQEDLVRLALNVDDAQENVLRGPTGDRGDQGFYVTRNELGDFEIGYGVETTATRSSFTSRSALDMLLELIRILYLALGININNSEGSLRNIEDIELELRQLNPDILLSYQELMKF